MWYQSIKIINCLRIQHFFVVCQEIHPAESEVDPLSKLEIDEILLPTALPKLVCIAGADRTFCQGNMSRGTGLMFLEKRTDGYICTLSMHLRCLLLSKESNFLSYF